ncbi:MAG: Molybdopterin adenylyltransferase, partial [uncultured Blastococcus sp.]
ERAARRRARAGDDRVQPCGGRRLRGPQRTGAGRGPRGAGLRRGGPAGPARRRRAPGDRAAGGGGRELRRRPDHRGHRPVPHRRHARGDPPGAGTGGARHRRGDPALRRGERGADVGALPRPGRHRRAHADHQPARLHGWRPRRAHRAGATAPPRGQPAPRRRPCL